MIICRFVAVIFSIFVSKLDIIPAEKYNLIVNLIERFFKMKKFVKIIIPVILTITIVACLIWYLFVYDRGFTRDMLLNVARYSESHGNHNVAAWFYNQAYSQSTDNESVAIELAEQYKSIGNFTKAEYTLSNAIADGGGIDVYVALCKTYVQQDKILDAVNMLNNVTNEEVKAQLESIRPAAPTAAPEPGFYNQYISATLTAENGTLYASTSVKYPSVPADLYTAPIQLQDGENMIYAVTIAENGLVSPLAFFGYTVGGVVEKMEFADSSVEAEVRKLLSVPAEKILLTNDLWTIKSFTMPANATSYGDLKHMPFLESLAIENGVANELHHIAGLANLTELKISGTTVSQENLKTIATLPMLQKLTLQSCGITSISVLDNAKELVVLDLNNNTIRDISALQSMTQLQELYLQHNTVTDLSALSGATALTKLDVSSNALTSLAPLNTLTGLKWLNAGTNQITDLGEIGKLSALTYLALNNNKLSSVGNLSECTTLTELNLATNSLTDISALSALVNVMYLDFSYNQVNQIPKFPRDCALVTINGSNNQISSLENLRGLSHLNNVHMDYNTGITSIDPLVDCPVLIEVNVYETGVTSVTKLTDQSIIVNYKPI